MGRLGFDKDTGFVFEGRNDPTYPVWPTPVLSQATLITSPLDHASIPQSYDSHPFAWLFREDSFDPVSKIRRGRLFQRITNSPESALVEAHPAVLSDERQVSHQGGRRQRMLDVYYECMTLLNLPRRGEGLHLALGVAQTHSMWRIVQTERTANTDVLVTLRSESTFGILPTLNEAVIAPIALPAVQDALGRVLDAAYSELPTSVVDQCRNAATVITGSWLRQISNEYKNDEKDLGKWIRAVNDYAAKEEKPRDALTLALQIIAKLHPRGKDNERARLGTRRVDSDDATLAVHILAFALREIGWALD